MNRKDFEIMAPVGAWESLYAAHQGGADAISTTTLTSREQPIRSTTSVSHIGWNASKNT